MINSLQKQKKKEFHEKSESNLSIAR
jgi:hypothetical protein